MTSDEKTIAHNYFKLLIYEADGVIFERLFTSIMNYSESGFQQIRPWGNIGDRKNDGYVKSKGIFYQVYAPEDIRFKYSEAVLKLKNDFAGLLSQWSPVNEFYFVINDKYKGVNADVEITMNQILLTNNLANGGVIVAKDLENRLFSLTDDQIQTIIGHIPNPARIQLNYSVLNEVIKYIMQLSLVLPLPPDIKMPDWDQKIKFNQLSKATATILNNGYLQVNSLQKYLDDNSNFLADTLRDKMNEIYISEKKIFSGDELFWAIVKKASPKNETPYQTAVIIIMAKYFEACDIFEFPREEE